MPKQSFARRADEHGRRDAREEPLRELARRARRALALARALDRAPAPRGVGRGRARGRRELLEGLESVEREREAARERARGPDASPAARLGSSGSGGGAAAAASAACARAPHASAAAAAASTTPPAFADALEVARNGVREGGAIVAQGSTSNAITHAHGRRRVIARVHVLEQLRLLESSPRVTK